MKRCKWIKYRFGIIFMRFCQKLHMNIYNSNNSFGYLPSTHIEASLKGWPNNHVRGCILKELLVSGNHWNVHCIAGWPLFIIQHSARRFDIMLGLTRFDIMLGLTQFDIMLGWYDYDRKYYIKKITSCESIESKQTQVFNVIKTLTWPKFYVTVTWSFPVYELE